MSLARQRIAWLAVLAALVAGGLAVVRASSAALSLRDASVWAYGELVLADEPVSAGLFDVERMLPGRTEVRCLTVRYEGASESAQVGLYATAVSGGLAPYLDVLVETGARCDGFVPEAVAYAGTLDGMPASRSEAQAAWRAGPGARRAYRFSVTLRPDPAAEGLQATARFAWEAGRQPGPEPAAGARADAGPPDLLLSSSG